jgi:hypothetical protein
MSNSLADGFYSATLSIRRRYWDERNSNKKNQAEMEEIK